jgi:hypothetical protein
MNEPDTYFIGQGGRLPVYRIVLSDVESTRYYLDRPPVQASTPTGAGVAGCSAPSIGSTSPPGCGCDRRGISF